MKEKLGAGIMGVIIGAIAGAAIAFGIGMISCVIGIVNCSGESLDIVVVPIGALIGGLIGFFVAYQLETEAQEADEREKARMIYEAKDKQYEQWESGLKQQYQSIINSLSSSMTCPAAMYYEIKQWKNTMDTDDYRYEQTFEREYNAYCKALKEHIKKALSEKVGWWWINSVKNALICLDVALDNKDENVKYAEKRIWSYILIPLQRPSVYLFKNSAYGNVDLPIDDKEAMEELEEKKNEIEEKLKKAINNIRHGTKDIVELISDNIYKDLMFDAELLMWYYAYKKPFNVEKFNIAKNYFEQFTVVYLKDHDSKNNDNFTCVNIDELIAQIYAKYQIGGIGTASKEIEYMEKWLRVKLQNKYYEECKLLASGLAWMGLYENELMVLRKLVEAGVQLSEDLQDRLSFLESGGVEDIMIYSEDSTVGFKYDSSSIDWSAKEFEAFFRKLAMKKIRVNYSLGISNWTKTLPLTSGQKVTNEQLYTAFETLVRDYDGEIICSRSDVKAINLENVTYKDAVLFSFQSERNKCATVAFSSEKFGRNLNITMLTLFTPVEDATIEQLEKYCYALKNNMYIESFRESILQVIDETLREKSSIYDQNEGKSVKKVFD